MCNDSCIDFGRRHLVREEVSGKRVLEVGALDVNGSLRPFLQTMCPREYIGVDIEMGPNVDQICDAGGLVDRFGPDAFDLVVSTEMLEHVRDWRRVVRNLKRVTAPGGTLVLTTRSFGVAYHGYPNDFWRYEIEDARTIFSDMQVLNIEPDPMMPGVLLKVRKPAGFQERDLSGIALYSIVTRKRSPDISDGDVLLCKTRLLAGRIARRLHLIR